MDKSNEKYCLSDSIFIVASLDHLIELNFPSQTSLNSADIAPSPDSVSSSAKTPTEQIISNDKPRYCITPTVSKFITSKLATQPDYHINRSHSLPNLNLAFTEKKKTERRHQRSPSVTNAFLPESVGASLNFTSQFFKKIYLTSSDYRSSKPVGSPKVRHSHSSYIISEISKSLLVRACDMIDCDGYLVFMTDTDGIYLRCNSVWRKTDNTLKEPNFILRQDALSHWYPNYKNSIDLVMNQNQTLDFIDLNANDKFIRKLRETMNCPIQSLLMTPFIDPQFANNRNENIIGLIIFINKTKNTECLLPNTPRLNRTESCNISVPRFTITDLFLCKSFGIFVSLSLTDNSNNNNNSNSENNNGNNNNNSLSRSNSITPFGLRNNNVRDKILVTLASVAELLHTPSDESTMSHQLINTANNLVQSLKLTLNQNNQKSLSSSSSSSSSNSSNNNNNNNNNSSGRTTREFLSSPGNSSSSFGDIELYKAFSQLCEKIVLIEHSKQSVLPPISENNGNTDNFLINKLTCTIIQPEDELNIPMKLESKTNSEAFSHRSSKIEYILEGENSPLILFHSIICPVIIKLQYRQKDVMVGRIILDRTIETQPIIDIPITSSFLSASAKICQKHKDKQQWYLYKVICTLRGTFVERFSENV